MDKPAATKFTKAQQEVVDLLNNGWELGVSTDPTRAGHTRYWAQHGKVGHGGETRRVPKGTVEALKRLNVLKPVERGPGRFDAVYELDKSALA